MSIFLPDPTGQPNKRARIILLSTAIVVVLGLVLAGPAWRELKELRAQRLAAKAEGLAAQNRFEEAAGAARQALSLHPENRRSVRLLAQMSGKLNAAEVLGAWHTLARFADLSVAEREELAGAALVLMRLDLAEQQLVPLLQNSPVSLKTLRLAAAYYEMKGESVRAAKFQQSVLEREPEDKPAQLTLGRLLVRSEDPAEREVGKELLLPNSTSRDTVGLEAIRIMAAAKVLNQAEAGQCLEQFKRNPHRDARDRLTEADLQLAATPYKRNEVFGSLLESTSDDAGRLELGRWFNRQQAPDWTLRALPLEKAKSNREAFLVHLDATAALGQWERLDEILSAPGTPLEPILSALYQARVARESKRARREELLWAQALELAADDPRSLALVAEYAERVGDYGTAENAYRKMTRVPRAARFGYERLVRLFDKQQKTAQVKTVLTEMAQRFPDDPLARNDLAYLNLLLNEKIDDARTESEGLVQKFPNYFSYRTTLALAHLRAQRPAEAKAAYSGLKFRWSDALPGWQAVYVAVLGANKQEAEAQTLARRINKARLKPEEQALIQNYL